jgi:uridylate kinase
MRVTICFGGSIVAPDKPNAELIQEIAGAVRLLRSKKHEVLIVAGGGGPARMYIEAAQKFEIPRAELDRIGIDVTRLNARMIISALGKIAEPNPPTAVEAAVRATFKNKVPVMGGTTPGQTTDAVAAMLARVSGSQLLVFFSDVDGVYTADPKKDPKARKIKRMTAEELVRQFGKVKPQPGMKTIMDPVAAKIIGGAKFRTLVLGVHEIKRLPEIVEGAEHSGTTIEPVSE